MDIFDFVEFAMNNPHLMSSGWLFDSQLQKPEIPGQVDSPMLPPQPDAGLGESWRTLTLAEGTVLLVSAEVPWAEAEPASLN